MAKPTFHDMVTSRAIIASAPVDEDQFAKFITTVNDRFGLNLVPRKEAYELFRDRIRVVAGRFWDEMEAAERKVVLERLGNLRKTSSPSSLSSFLCEKGCMRW